jgi:DNA-binding CsgD family transcriptional regulator
VVGPHGLTLREKTVLQYVANGRNYAECAEILELSQFSVHEAAKSMRQKIGAKNISHAIAIAFRENIVR